jgi:hypothetical protein
MEQYSKDNPGAKIEYHYPVKQCMKYEGGASSGSGDQAKKLKGVYDGKGKWGGEGGEYTKQKEDIQKHLDQQGGKIKKSDYQPSAFKPPDV